MLCSMTNNNTRYHALVKKFNSVINYQLNSTYHAIGSVDTIHIDSRNKFCTWTFIWISLPTFNLQTVHSVFIRSL